MVSRREARLVAGQLEELRARHAGQGDEDIVSFYPPEAAVDRHLFGIAGTHIDGTRWGVGDCDARFPLQSISKVFTYGLALEDNGREATLARVGVEPSGEPFNAVTFDEAYHRPHNPMINTGALVAANLVHGVNRDEKVRRLLERLRVYAGNPELAVDQDVLAHELRSNDRNLGLCYLMRSLEMITGDILDTITVYLSMCSVTVTASELAVMGATLAHGGINPLTGQRALARRYVRDVVSVMNTCGMYDAAGQWATDVGIPAKSGVSGGLVATIVNHLGLGVFSPGLDVHGHSVRGVNVCRELSERFGLHIFADPGESSLGRAAATADTPAAELTVPNLPELGVGDHSQPG
jgi:glutaminase